MVPASRRAFLQQVGSGMFAAGLGASLAAELGLSTALGAEDSAKIPLGEYDRLVELMRGTPAEKLQPRLAKLVLEGEVDLKQLIAAASLANAVTFGGCDYVGFHTAMAMLPALQMSRELPGAKAPLPVLKVLYRNAQQIQSVGGASQTALEALHAAEHAAVSDRGREIRDACRDVDLPRAETLLADAGASPLAMFNALQPAVQDDLNVHRFVFAHRTHGLADLLGEEYSLLLLRQCVRFCIEQEQNRIERKRPASPIRALLPKMLDQHKLVGKKLGQRKLDDAAVETLAETVYQGPRERAADAVAAALAEGVDPEVVGEAISLASNLYVLRQGPDPWRTHGDSAGVHSSDAANAWRNMVRAADAKYVASGLIVAAYHAGIQSAPFKTPPYPTDEHRALIKIDDPKKLLAEAEDAIRHNDQGRSAAAIAIYGERGHAVEPVFALMLKYTLSEDGRLHGEKFYHTVREEYASTRPAFRWRQIVALARVTASAYGYNREDQHGFRAAGYEEACKLLGVEA
ncbi:MAG: hypothetical protein RIC55_12050 [Pirellulaceae bacterium]